MSNTVRRSAAVLVLLGSFALAVYAATETRRPTAFTNSGWGTAVVPPANSSTVENATATCNESSDNQSGIDVLTFHTWQAGGGHSALSLKVAHFGAFTTTENPGVGTANATVENTVEYSTDGGTNWTLLASDSVDYSLRTDSVARRT